MTFDHKYVHVVIFHNMSITATTACLDSCTDTTEQITDKRHNFSHICRLNTTNIKMVSLFFNQQTFHKVRLSNSRKLQRTQGPYSGVLYPLICEAPKFYSLFVEKYAKISSMYELKAIPQLQNFFSFRNNIFLILSNIKICWRYEITSKMKLFPNALYYSPKIELFDYNGHS